jgi:type I restriction enzyme S subunit
MKYETVTLSDVSIGGGSYGIAASAVPYSENLPTYLRITDINDDGTINFDGLKSVADPNASKYYLAPNDIVFARTGASTGRNYFYDDIDRNFVYAGFLIKFSIDPKKVNPLYVKYYCRSKKYYDWVTSFNTGSTRGNINAQMFGNMPLPLPPKEQQDTLAVTLSALDAKIANNSKINHHLAKLTQAIFKSWFIDFEPWGGEQPADWREVELGDVVTLNAGGDKPVLFSSTPTNECSIPVFSNGIDNFGLYGYTGIPKVTEESVTVSARGTIGFVCLRQEPFVPIVRLITAIPKKEFITAKYLYLYLNSIHIVGVGTTQQQLTVPDFKRYRILLPNYDVVNNFTETVAPIFDSIRHNRGENVQLVEARDTLLPRLMSGELSIADLAVK